MILVDFLLQQLNAQIHIFHNLCRPIAWMQVTEVLSTQLNSSMDSLRTNDLAAVSLPTQSIN